MTIGKATVELIHGDIVRQDVDAIVNAANSSLMGGGGVDGAIHRAAGPELKEACRPLAPCPPGEARITPGFRLKARHVIHTVGPIYHGGNYGEAEVLANAHRNSLSLAAQHGLTSVAFPAISTGIYGYPVELAAAVALGAVRDFLTRDAPLRLVRFVLWSPDAVEAFERALQQIAGETHGPVS
jgi:O-acetyl-ADP-ribose deacetylase (regulator of RNase III)